MKRKKWAAKWILQKTGLIEHKSTLTSQNQEKNNKQIKNNGILTLKRYLMFIWNSNIAGCPAFLFAKYGNLSSYTWPSWYSDASATVQQCSILSYIQAPKYTPHVSVLEIIKKTYLNYFKVNCVRNQNTKFKNGELMTKNWWGTPCHKKWTNKQFWNKINVILSTTLKHDENAKNNFQKRMYD